MDKLISRKVRKRPGTWLLSSLVLILVGWFVYDASLPVTSAFKPTVTPITKDKASIAGREADHRFKIVIDAGHGGKDPGANGVSGNHEKEYTLALSRKVAELLEQEPMFEAHMTRTDDSFVELEDRALFANEQEADAFISIHGNTFTDPSVSGTESYYFNDDSLALAQTIHGELVKATGFGDRGIKKEGWKVLTHNERTAILLEVGFLTNKNEESALLNDAKQDLIAQSIVNGLKQYFNPSDR